MGDGLNTIISLYHLLLTNLKIKKKRKNFDRLVNFNNGCCFYKDDHDDFNNLYSYQFLEQREKIQYDKKLISDEIVLESLSFSQFISLLLKKKNPKIYFKLSDVFVVSSLDYLINYTDEIKSLKPKIDKISDFQDLPQEVPFGYDYNHLFSSVYPIKQNYKLFNDNVENNRDFKFSDIPKIPKDVKHFYKISYGKIINELKEENEKSNFGEGLCDFICESIILENKLSFSEDYYSPGMVSSYSFKFSIPYDDDDDNDLFIKIEYSDSGFGKEIYFVVEDSLSFSQFISLLLKKKYPKIYFKLSDIFVVSGLGYLIDFTDDEIKSLKPKFDKVGSLKDLSQESILRNERF
ncbi:hypothetical protein ACTFIY_000662 [Dictyostelium cf. discoideum]